MKASVGDRILINGLHLGEPDRDGEIVAVEGRDGAPPYWVRWEADGHVSLFFPSSDAIVEHDTDRPPSGSVASAATVDATAGGRVSWDAVS